MKRIFLCTVLTLCCCTFAASSGRDKEAKNFVRAGFYECDITPPYNADVPGSFAKTQIRKIAEKLAVRALALTDGKVKIALIGIDNIGVGPKFLERLKAALPGIFVLNSASHTHYGGNLRDKVDVSKASPVVRRLYIEESTYFDESYYELCLRQCITAVKLAFDNLQEVEFSFGKGKVEGIIFNRRIRMKNGSVQTHAGKGNPDSKTYAGPVDDELGVMGVWKKGSDELLGFVLNFSCHACINFKGVNPDFCGAAVETVRGVYGKNTGAVYINGASGDVTQIDNMSFKRDIGNDIALKLGRIIGGKAIQILAASDRGQITTLNYLTETYAAVYRPKKKIDEKTLQQSYKVVESGIPKLSTEYIRAKNRIKSAWSYSVSPAPKPFKMELAAVQIGPLVIGSTPGEMFAQFALDFKKSSKHPYTWFSQLSCGLTYIPTADAFDPKTGGGYEAGSAAFVPATGHDMTAILSRLADKLKPAAVPPPDTMPPARKSWGYNNVR